MGGTAPGEVAGAEGNCPEDKEAQWREERNGLEYKMIRGLVHGKAELKMRGWVGVSMKCMWSLERAGRSIHD